MSSLGFRVLGLGLRVSGLGFRVGSQGLVAYGMGSFCVCRMVLFLRRVGGANIGA